MAPWQRLIDALRAPGAKYAVEEAAPTQIVTSTPISPSEKEDGPGGVVPVKNITGFVGKSHTGRLDRWLDLLVRASGSEPVFLLIVAGLLAWAFSGIEFGNVEIWAVVMSDFQAILCYVFDSFLMRQQLNGYDRMLRVSASLRSRGLSHKNMICQITASGRYRATGQREAVNTTQLGFGDSLPAENWVGRVSTFASRVLGHIITVAMFWVGILIWIGFGASLGWSNIWQLYINSATSALMVLIFAFLANIRERHEAYIEKCLNLIFELDSALELKLRTITGYAEPNPTVVVPAPKVSRLQRVIFYYADVVGTLVGIGILIVFLVVWVSIGPALSFDANWWLIVGTYAGLIGLNDGFVLRNVQAQFNDYENAAFEESNLEDMSLFVEARVADPTTAYTHDKSINYRISAKMGAICAHQITVVLGVVLIIGLIVGATVMGWSTTGQLLCNIPPSIVESFFMMILVTCHNISDSRRRVDLHNIYLRRLTLLAYADRLEPIDENGGA